MTKLLCLLAGMGLVTFLGFAIDANSRVSVARPAVQLGDCMIFASGRVEGATSEIELRPRLADRIADVLVREGQTVNEGDVLLRVCDEQYRHEVDLAAAALELAEAQLERLLNGAHPEARSEAAALYRAKQVAREQVQRNWDRIRKLREARAVSQQEADDQRALLSTLTEEMAAAKARLQRVEAAARPDEVRIEKARIQAAKARLELAKEQLERAKLRAPCRGQILKIDVEPGEMSGPESLEPAIFMVDSSELRVRAFVEELDAPLLELGMAATISADGLADREFHGRVVQLSPRMSHKELTSDDPTERYDTKTREVLIALEPNEGLVLGLRVDVVIDPRTGAAEDSEPTEKDLPQTPSEQSPETPSEATSRSSGTWPTPMVDGIGGDAV